MRKYLQLCVFAIIIFSIACKQSQQETKINYSSPLPDTTALTFLPGIVSKDSLDFNAAFSPHSDRFYFSRSLHGKYVIMETAFQNDAWTEPVVSTIFDTAFSNTDPFFSPDGDLYFISNRPANPTDTIRDYDIYMLSKNDKYLMPRRLNDVNSDSTEYYVSVAKNGNIYFASYRDGNLDLYMSQKADNKWLQPVNLGGVVNSISDEHDPLIAPDESYLIFTSTRPGGLGEADLYISFQKDGVWQTPKNMGPKINTATYEYCPNLSPDAQYFLFSSELDVKWIGADVLKGYK